MNGTHVRTTTIGRSTRAWCAAAAVVVTVSAVVPISAVAAAEHASRSAAHVRSYDADILYDANQARASYAKHEFRMSHPLWRIAHAYAEHMARTGELIHNPALEREVTKVCPNWTALGENIGKHGGNDPRSMFKAYMHSAPHRANLLDGSYREVGVATVRVTRHHHVEQWNVMDFANHCD